MPSRENACQSLHWLSDNILYVRKNHSFPETLKAASLSPQSHQQVGWTGLLVTELSEIVHSQVAVSVVFSVVAFKEGAGHSGSLGPAT